MSFLTDGSYVRDTAAAIAARTYAALRARGFTDLSEGSFARILADAAVNIPFTEFQDSIEDLVRNTYPGSAVGQALDDILELLDTREVAAPATGDVHLNLTSIPSTPSPYFAAGDLSFSDDQGNQFDQVEDASPPTAFFDSNETGTASQSIDSGGTLRRVAQRFVTTNTRFMQAARVTVTKGAVAPVATVSIQTDSAGEPSGTLADANLTKASVALNDGTATDIVFTSGALVAGGTYWLVLEFTAGDGTLDGGTGGTADQVFVYTQSGGTWAADSNIENGNIEVYEGVVVEVQCTLPGPAGNVDASAIVNADPTPGPVATRFNTNVSTFTNLADLTGGQNREDDRDYLFRVRNAASNRETASIDGIVTAVKGIASDVVATGRENITDTGGTEDKVFDSNETGTASETIDGTTLERIAQRMVTTDERFVQHFNATFAHVSGTPEFTVRLETDSAGDPSGTLAFTDASLASFLPADGTQSSGTFSKGAYLPAGTYWLVFTQTAGSATLDGGTGGTADQVEVFNGATWAADANIENGNLELVGGIPPHGFRVWVLNADADDIATAIGPIKPAGIKSDGLLSGTWGSVNLGDVTINYDTPVEVPIVVSVTANVTSDFVGDEDTIRDAIVTYIGGNETDGTAREGLDVGDKVVIKQISSILLEKDRIAGVDDITVLRIDRKADTPTPAGLTGSNEVNLSMDTFEKATVETTATDIAVTLVVV